MSNVTLKELIIPGRKSKEKFVYLCENVLNEKECQQWIHDAQKIGFQAASLIDGKQKNPHRNNDRVLLKDIEKSKFLKERLVHILPKTWVDDQKITWKLVGLNEQMSFLRYRKGEKYGKHVDVPYVDEKNNLHSFITCQIYLNEGFEGGETRFDQEVGYVDFHKRSHLDVIPKSGSALLFEHELTHEGCLVKNGEKFTVRIDVVYTRD